MDAYSQSHSPLRLTTPLGDDALLLIGLSGFEGVSELFRFQLDLLAPHRGEVEFSQIVGQPVTAAIQMESLEPRWIDGVAIEVGEMGQDEEFTRLEIAMVPRLWWWTQRTNSRVYQQLSVPQILSAVLNGLTMRLDLTQEYAARNYCVQYQETDFAFVSRLMEEEGMFYFFEHSEGEHTLVITDSAINLASVENPDPLSYDGLEGGTRSEPRVTSWRKRQVAVPASTTLRDHSFELPASDLEVDETIPESIDVGTVRHALRGSPEQPEIFEYPGGYAKRFDGIAPGGAERSAEPAKVFADGLRTCKLRAEAIAARSLAIEADSSAINLIPGKVFQLQHHRHADGKYFILRVEHSAALGAGYHSASEQAKVDYRNQLLCLPHSLPYRPQRSTPRPQIVGVQTARVVGPADSELFCDKYGRVKVQFYWDRAGRADADSSCWVRVSQVWAGNRWGAFFWPRVGNEVVVAFLEGDPDRPLIVGSVYNAANMPPPELPGEATVGGIKSAIFGGDPMRNYNALFFHDQQGHEFLQIHSEKDELQHSESNRFHYVPHGEFSFHGQFF